MTENGVHIPRVLSADETSEVEKLVARGRYDEAAERFGGRVTHAHEQRDMPPMSDFDTITAGTADLVKRLRDYEEYEQSRDGQIICVKSDIAQEAAARIERLEAEVRELNMQVLASGSQAQEAYEAQLKAEAATAAAYEVAARECDYYAKSWDDLKINGSSISVVATAIRALATPDQTAALDKLIAEVEARVWAEAAQVASRYNSGRGSCSATARAVVAAILAASKKGGV